jgi:hypothetical protein
MWMRAKWGTVLSAVALGLMPLAVTGMRAAIATHSAVPSAASMVTAVGDLHGFALAYDKANPDGSVTAVLRRGRESIVYLGGPGSRLSVGVSSKVIVVKVKGKEERVIRHGLLLGASNPTVPGNGTARSFGPAGFAATRSVIGDLRATGLPRRALALIAAEDRKLTRGAPHITTEGGPGHQSVWCIDKLYGANMSAVAGACDTRTVLQQETGNNFIADEMVANDKCSGSCGALYGFNVHDNYTFAADNTVVKMIPNSPQNSDCSGFTSENFAIDNIINFAYGEATCNDRMVPQGTGTNTGVGAYWSSSSGDSHVYITEIAVDNATSSTNPDTVMFVFQAWSGGGDYTSCPDSQC